MLKQVLSMLSVVALGIVAGSPNIFTDCTNNCEQIYEACNKKSGSCTYFETYFSLSNLSTNFNTSQDFIVYADDYCLNATLNGTSYVCDVFVKDLIDCIAYSNCWYNMSTTAYSSNCDYYASVTTNVTVTSSLNEYELCFANWDSYFGDLFGGTYVSTSVNFLYDNCTFNYSLLNFSTVNYSTAGSSVNITVTFELSLTFYSEYSYYEFIDSLNGSTVGYIWSNSSYLNYTWLGVNPFVTECCNVLSYSSGTDVLDYICTTAQETTGGGQTTTGGGQGKHNGAVSNKPFIFNFILISIILFSACNF